MEPLTVPVPGVVKQGPGCGFDRLREPANQHIPIRRGPGHGPWDVDGYGYRRLVDSVSLLTPELLAEVGRTVVERGHTVAAEKPGAALRGRCHSFVAGTDVHHPTDRSLPMDAARCMVRDVSRACGGLGPLGWRRKEYLCGKLRRLYPGVATSRLANPRPKDVEAPLRLALKLADRAEAGRAEIDGRLGIPGSSDSVRGFIGHVRPRADLTGRRILKGGTIPHRGKVHPISGPHTRWIPKGKAGVPVEPGVSVRVPEDRHGFLPHRSVMWEGSDVDVAVPMGGEARGRGSRISRW